MSGNQKQTATGGPQTQRFSNSSYVTSNGPVKQEGICLLPPPHYRMMPPQRTDGFPVSTPTGTYVPQPPNQGGNPGPGLRGIAPSVPPNQASTPPNTDIKVQTLPQQASMNHMYMQQQVRSSQGTYYARTPGPANQTQRMPNHNNRPQQTIFGSQTQYVQIQPMYIPTPNTVPYYGQRPPGFVQPTIPMYPGQHLTSYQYNPPPTQAPTPYYYSQTMMQRAGPLPQPQPTNPNPAQATIQNVPLVTNTPQHQPFQRQQNKRRANAISIIDPDTGADRLNEIYEDHSHPPSGESSARQTPQPAPHSHNKEVQAAFAKQVMQAINTDIEHVHIDDSDHHKPLADHIEQSPYPPPPLQAVPSSSNRLEHIVQSSNLKVQAKEFFLPNTAKDTPIVSANCDAVEVTLPNKSPKDRESPVKGRKPQRDPATIREHKDSVKESNSNKDNSDKQSSIVKDVEIKQKETTPPINATNIVQVQPIPVKDSSKEIIVAQEKKSQKKETKIESKVPSVELSECASIALAPVQPIPSAQDVSANAKSKQNVQRVVQKQNVPQNSQKPAQAIVPPPQPAKANNKSHKKNELNQKGANKEGTDMDAFNDNGGDKEEVNANVTVTTDNDIINANSGPVSNNATPINRDININIELSLKSNEAVTIKSEPVKPLKTKIDITDIVKEKPKPIKPFTPVESHDETDRAVISTEKLVQAKNEANTKVNSENNGNDNKYNYKEGQWSPSNPSGVKAYHRDLLLALRDSPASRRRPDNIPDVLADDRGRLSDGRQSMGGRTDFTNPPFANYGGKSSSQRGAPPKRNSQSGKMGGSGAKNQRTVITISVREEVKLHETKNAWRPARLLNKGESATEDDKKTEELYKKVRGVLNKLTPQKFETLLSQIKSLHIDTVERLQGVIDLVFEKAVDEPNFSVAYALMCSELALMQVPTSTSSEERPEVINFRKLLITRCQVEFEKQSLDETVRNEKVKEIEATTDAEKKKDLQFDLEEYDRRLRMKSVGNIRFIGELFKQNMLTVNIMQKCLRNLLENKDEESLECLCKLLTTIGKELESKNVSLNSIFETMKNIVDKREGKVSSRIRFMLQDVIDLRNTRWIPRRQDLNPKTIDQIKKEADSEQLNIQLMNSVPITPRKDDRGNSGPNADRKGRGRNVSDDGWIVNTNRNRTQQFTVQSDKLKSKAPQIDEPLGSSQLFGNWGKGSVGSNIKAPPQSLGPNTANMYAALAENVETDKRSLSKYSARPGSKEPYSSKGPSLERNYGKSYDGRGSRSGSQHRSNDSSGSSSQRSTPAPIIPPLVPKPIQSIPIPQLTQEQMERRINNSLDEYVSGSCTVEEYFIDISAVIPSTYYPKLIEDSYIHVLEKSQQARSKTGTLFAKLIKSGNFLLEDYCVGLEGILSQADDLKIDIPKFWDYLAEIIVDVICEETLPLSRLHKSFQILSQDHTAKVLAPLFKLVVIERGPNFLQSIWQASGLQLSDFMPSSLVNSFIKDNQFEFLVGGSAPVGQNQLSYEQIRIKLSELLRGRTSLDDIVNWITANVGERVTENKFIRVLATAIFQDSISKNKLMSETLSAHNNLLLKYVDNCPVYELQCLYALQALIHKLEHPQGLLLSICDKLYEGGTFSQESFIAWETSNDPAEQEGKGVALKQLTSFFTQLKENDEEEYDGSSASEEA